MTAIVTLIFVAFTAPTVAQTTKTAPLPSFDVADSLKFTPQFCVNEPFDQICASFPHDQTDFSASFEYMVVSAIAQQPFDFFSWQAFVALSWPMLGRDEPATSIHNAPPDTSPRWHQFQRRQVVMGIDTAGQTCGAGGEAVVITGDLVQADGTVLIDQAGNYVVYETRINETAETYVLDNALQTLAGQRDYAQAISFPQGRIGTNATPASILIKTAWRILPDDNPADFITAPGLIHIPANRAHSGKDTCLPVTLAMVGMHIVTRVHSGNGDEWIWSTFEHVRNAPTASNARAINSIYAVDLFPTGCEPPVQTAETYSFFDTNCPDCQTNADPGSDWQWAPQQPFALINGQPAKHGTQVVRCWDIFEETQRTNAKWQARLKGTGLENYLLISAQWRGANKSPLFEHGEVPRYLSNLTMETFIQGDKSGTCLGCHADAKAAAGQGANFTFLLKDVSR